MKVYISADMEGLTGVSDWDEVRKGHGDYGYFVEQMHQEVIACCQGLLDAGVTSITVKDAHASGRNLDLKRLPAQVELISGWSGHPFSMIQELDDSYAGICFVGYHSQAGSGGNPLSHTMSLAAVDVRLNGLPCSELLLFGSMAGSLRVPILLVSGDRNLIDFVNQKAEKTLTVATNTGIGASVLARHPFETLAEIQRKAKTSIVDFNDCASLAGRNFCEAAELSAGDFVLEVEYRLHQDAYSRSFFPGVQLVSDRKVRFETRAYSQVLTAAKFLL